MEENLGGFVDYLCEKFETFIRFNQRALIKVICNFVTNLIEQNRSPITSLAAKELSLLLFSKHDTKMLEWGISMLQATDAFQDDANFVDKIVTEYLQLLTETELRWDHRNARAALHNWLGGASLGVNFTKVVDLFQQEGLRRVQQNELTQWLKFCTDRGKVLSDENEGLLVEKVPLLILQICTKSSSFVPAFEQMFPSMRSQIALSPGMADTVKELLNLDANLDYLKKKVNGFALAILIGVIPHSDGDDETKTAFFRRLISPQLFIAIRKFCLHRWWKGRLGGDDLVLHSVDHVYATLSELIRSVLMSKMPSVYFLPHSLHHPNHRVSHYSVTLLGSPQSSTHMCVRGALRMKRRPTSSFGNFSVSCGSNDAGIVPSSR